MRQPTKLLIWACVIVVALVVLCGQLRQVGQGQRTLHADLRRAQAVGADEEPGIPGSAGITGHVHVEQAALVVDGVGVSPDRVARVASASGQ